MATVRSSQLLAKLELEDFVIFWEKEGFAGLQMWRVFVMQSEQHVIYRLKASRGQGGPNWHGRNWRKATAVSGSSRQLILKKGAPGDQVWDLLSMQLASYLEGAHWCGWCPCTYIFIKNRIMIWYIEMQTMRVNKDNKPVLSGHSKRRPKIGFQDRLSLNAGQKHCRMLQWEHSAILSTFIKLPFVIKTFVLTILEWPLKTGFTVCRQFLMASFYKIRAI